MTISAISNNINLIKILFTTGILFLKNYNFCFYKVLQTSTKLEYEACKNI